MAANDEVDFRAEFKILTDTNEELVRLALHQRKIIVGFCVAFLLAVILLLIVSSISLKEFIDIVRLLHEVGLQGEELLDTLKR